MPGKIIRVDIDGTICTTNGLDYAGAVPNRERIEKINQWFRDGHVIIYWTARGCLLGVDYTELTERQLREWKCCYHELDMNKPLYDEFYDDRAFNAMELDK